MTHAHGHARAHATRNPVLFQSRKSVMKKKVIQLCIFFCWSGFLLQFVGRMEEPTLMNMIWNVKKSIKGVTENVHVKMHPTVVFQSKKGFLKHTHFDIFRIYKPVCGKDNITYSNKWELDCKDVEKQCKGKCPCKEECLIPK